VISIAVAVVVSLAVIIDPLLVLQGAFRATLHGAAARG
tara:strand:+ start:185 stop:298 length:114 start_codon:yes stop_codon:yes gene_type:complete